MSCSIRSCVMKWNKNGFLNPLDYSVSIITLMVCSVSLIYVTIDT